MINVKGFEAFMIVHSQVCLRRAWLDTQGALDFWQIWELTGEGTKGALLRGSCLGWGWGFSWREGGGGRSRRSVGPAGEPAGLRHPWRQAMISQPRPAVPGSLQQEGVSCTCLTPAAGSAPAGGAQPFIDRPNCKGSRIPPKV